MSGLPGYFELIRQRKNPFNYRLGLVDYARTHGLKAAARAPLRPQQKNIAGRSDFARTSDDLTDL